jgi:Pyruvate/2-oxoacid:ferredoxin oxidoreductase gamma subunit
MIVLGYMTALLGIVSKEAVRRAIQEHVPPKTEDQNIQAFEEGYKLGLATL